MNNIELAQALQDALFAHPQTGDIPIPASLVTLVMEALRSLAATSAEPVAWITPETWKWMTEVKDTYGPGTFRLSKVGHHTMPLYTAPPAQPQPEVEALKSKMVDAARALSKWLLARPGQPAESFTLRRSLAEYDAALTASLAK